jgi:MoxR-like ATPase
LAQTAEIAPETTEADINSSFVQEFARKVRENVQRVFVGKGEAIDLAIIAMLGRGHVLLEDVPGTGKTTLAKTIAASLGLDFKRVQFTPDLVPSDVLGVNIYNTGLGQFEFKAGPIFTQILLADEINRATPRTQSALLEAMQEQQVSIDGVTMALSSPFLVLATLNPVEMEGTFMLPEAQLDRFLLKLSIGYPSDDEEAQMLQRFQTGDGAVAVDVCASGDDVERARDIVDQVRVADHVREYLVAVVRATRNNAQIRLGASPRASLALQHASQALAAIQGREYVMPDDVKVLSAPVLSHRIVLESSMQMRRRDASAVVDDVVAQIPVPIER